MTDKQLKQSLTAIIDVAVVVAAMKQNGYPMLDVAGDLPF